MPVFSDVIGGVRSLGLLPLFCAHLVRKGAAQPALYYLFPYCFGHKFLFTQGLQDNTKG